MTPLEITLVCKLTAWIVFFLKNLQAEVKNMSQERDELRSEVKSFENQLNAVAVEKAALYKEFQSVMDQLSELKENLQVEQKEKEVSIELLLAIANRGKWLGNLSKSFVVCFCWLFCGSTLHKTWQDSAILPTWVANHSAGSGSSCPLTEFVMC